MYDDDDSADDLSGDDDGLEDDSYDNNDDGDDENTNDRNNGENNTMVMCIYIYQVDAAAHAAYVVAVAAGERHIGHSHDGPRRHGFAGPAEGNQSEKIAFTAGFVPSACSHTWISCRFS